LEQVTLALDEMTPCCHWVEVKAEHLEREGCRAERIPEIVLLSPLPSTRRLAGV